MRKAQQIGIWVALVWGAHGGGSAEATTPGWQRWAIAETETYALRYLPSSLPAGEPVPVVTFLHGSGSSPEAWQVLLAPLAEVLGCALLVPKATSNLGFGVGADDETVRVALARLRAEVAIDETRLSIAGHSAGGAYAAVLAYSSIARFAGVFTLAAPYRSVLAVADPDYRAPLRLYYGDQDPNYAGGSYQALRQQWQRLGLVVEEEVASGFGHSTWPTTTLLDGFSFLLRQRYGTVHGCVPGPTRLCLAGGRFEVTARWRDSQERSGPAGTVDARSADSGLFWFFRPANWELQVKVLDGCALNQRWWVFAAGTTDVEYTLTVRDLARGASVEYHHPLGTPAPAITDTGALATCP
jgi:pimeloyl-ACP methyl ester carboxylesterase